MEGFVIHQASPTTLHTYTEAFTLTDVLRIPQARHQLQPGPVVWQAYSADTPPQLYYWDYARGRIDPTTGDFVYEAQDASGRPCVYDPPLRGTVVLVGFLL